MELDLATVGNLPLRYRQGVRGDPHPKNHGPQHVLAEMDPVWRHSYRFHR